MNEPMRVTDRRAMTVLADQSQEATSFAMSPVDVLLNAVQRNPNMDLAKLEKFMDLAERWRAAEAKRAYVTAFAECKRTMPPVIKDLLNKQYGSDYSSLANLVNTVNQHIGGFGLNANWDIDQSDGMAITCILTHVDGHSERVKLKGPIDTSGTKNPLQGIKSTLTYLEGATFQAITGVVAKAASKDDDGNGAGKKKPEAVAPDGYDDWKADMQAVAEEGTQRLQDTWKGSSGAFRRHVIKTDEVWWNSMKKKAEKAQVQS